MTAGATAGIEAVLGCLLNPGDALLVEEFTYAHALDACFLPRGWVGGALGWHGQCGVHMCAWGQRADDQAAACWARRCTLAHCTYTAVGHARSLAGSRWLGDV